MRIIELNPKEKNIDWNGLVGSLPEGTIYQTTYWGDYIRGKEKTEPIFLIAEDDSGNIVGSLLAYETPIFSKLLKFNRLGNILFNFINKKKIAITWMYGPLIYNKNRFDEIFVSFLKEIEIIARKRGVLFLHNISYPIHGDDIYFKRAHLNFYERGFSSREKATIFVDLTADLETLWENFKNSAKKAIKKCSDPSIKIEVMVKENLKEYYNLLCESRKRVGVEIPPVYPNEMIWNNLGGEKGCLDIFCVRKDALLLGAIGGILFNGIVFETAPAQSTLSFQKKIYVNDILKWCLIKNAKLKNARLYDLCGVPSHPRNITEIKQKQFKQKWGGKEISYRFYYKCLYKY